MKKLMTTHLLLSPQNELTLSLCNFRFKSTHSETRRKVLIVGIRFDEIRRLWSDLHPDLRQADLYLLDPLHKNAQCMGADCNNIFVIQGEISSQPLPEFGTTSFDTIIVDWSTIKFIDIEHLARFCEKYLERKAVFNPLDGVFLRNLSMDIYQHEPVDISGYHVDNAPQQPDGVIRSGVRLVNVDKHTHTIPIFLQIGWTTQHYKTFLGLSGGTYNLHYKNGSSYRKLNDDQVWLGPSGIFNCVYHTSQNIKVLAVIVGGTTSLHGIIEKFAHRGMICVPIDNYPLRKMGYEPKPGEMLKCRFVDHCRR